MKQVNIIDLTLVKLNIIDIALVYLKKVNIIELDSLSADSTEVDN